VDRDDILAVGTYGCVHPFSHPFSSLPRLASQADTCFDMLLSHRVVRMLYSEIETRRGDSITWTRSAHMARIASVSFAAQPQVITQSFAQRVRDSPAPLFSR
jgi:hypothetical protein